MSCAASATRLCNTVVYIYLATDGLALLGGSLGLEVVACSLAGP